MLWSCHFDHSQISESQLFHSFWFCLFFCLPICSISWDLCTKQFNQNRTLTCSNAINSRFPCNIFRSMWLLMDVRSFCCGDVSSMSTLFVRRKICDDEWFVKLFDSNPCLLFSELDAPSIGDNNIFVSGPAASCACFTCLANNSFNIFDVDVP